jgi:hypothetical protein
MYSRQCRASSLDLLIHGSCFHGICAHAQKRFQSSCKFSNLPMNASSSPGGTANENDCSPVWSGTRASQSRVIHCLIRSSTVSLRVMPVAHSSLSRKYRRPDTSRSSGCLTKAASACPRRRGNRSHSTSVCGRSRPSASSKFPRCGRGSASRIRSSMLPLAVLYVRSQTLPPPSNIPMPSRPGFSSQWSGQLR